MLITKKKLERLNDLTKEDNIIPFPGTEVPIKPVIKDPEDPNWLFKLPKGTKFLVQNKMQTNDFSLGEFEILAKREDIPAVLLHSDLNQEIMHWVDSRRFCRMWALFAILHMGED